MHFKLDRLTFRRLFLDTTAPAISPLQSTFVHSTGFIVLMGCLTAFDPMSIDMYLPAFSNIQSDLATTYASVELSLSSFFVGMALGQLVYGPLADHFGRKKPLLFGMLLYMIASFSCAFAPNIQTLIVLRILQAFGGCAGMVITRAIVRDLFNHKKAASFFSSLTLVMGLAPILAPSVGGFINQLLGWRMIFAILGTLNIACIACITWLLPETHPLQEKRVLKLSSVLKNYGHLLKDRIFIGYTIPDAFIRGGMFAYIAGSPFVFMEIFKIPSQYYGWIFGLNAVGLVTSSQINRLLLKYHDPDQILRTTRKFSALAAFALFVLPFFSTSVWAVVIPLFCFVGSLGFIGPNSGAMALSHQGHQAGLAAALYGTLQWTMAMASSFAVSHFHNGTLYPMTAVIVVCSLISLIGFQLLIGDRRPVPTPH
jgi:DHA1 family bicyclomycin/chloramphenicol resistance-like MFS transporter